ncbi:hypothetical protein NEHOM01_2350 [Nematocida homosporus]|nr:hypothetical protein NEHOM01_2350 [Nematocida homosporus]
MRRTPEETFGQDDERKGASERRQDARAAQGAAKRETGPSARRPGTGRPWRRRETGNRGLIPERVYETWHLGPRTAAGAEIAHFPEGEAARRHTADGRGAMQRATSDWRASLVPAAAVIPAPEGSVVVAAVKRSAAGQGARGESRRLKGSVEHGTRAERGRRGQEDLAARGEIRRLAEDGQRRRRLPGMLSLVRDEGRRIEDD